MKIWTMHGLAEDRFAVPMVIGTWETEPGAAGKCPECTHAQQRVVQPVIIEWEPGSDQIADFMGLGAILMTDRILRELQERFSGFEGWPVQMVQSLQLVRPTRPSKRTRPRVWLPYDGPAIYYLEVTACVPVDRERSTIRLRWTCETCKREYWETPVEGVEQRFHRYNRKTNQLDLVQIPRQPNKGIFVHQKDLKGSGIFRLHEFPGFVVATDEVKRYIQERKYTNIGFLEIGEALEE